MAYVPLIEADMAAGKPARWESFAKRIHDNFQDHETRVLAEEAATADVETRLSAAEDEIADLAGEVILERDQGTITSDVPVIRTSSTWNNAAIAFRGWAASFVETAKAVTSRYIDIKAGSAGDEERFSVGPAGLKVTAEAGVAPLNQLIGYGQLGVQGIIRRNGTHAVPTGVLAGEQIGQYDFRPRRDTGGEQATALLVATALENMTNTNRGTRFDLESTPVGSSARVKTLSMDGYETRSNGRYVSETDRNYLAVRHATASVTAAAGASVTAAALIPVGAVVVGISTRVMTALGTTTGTTGYQVGTVADPDRWGTKVGTAVGTKTTNGDWTADTTPPIFLAAQAVVLTANGGNFDGAGVIFIDVAYLFGDAA